MDMCCIAGHGKQRVVMHVDQVPAGQVASGITAVLHHLGLARTQRQNVDAGVVIPPLTVLPVKKLTGIFGERTHFRKRCRFCVGFLSGKSEDGSQEDSGPHAFYFGKPTAGASSN